jgi:hypothetical protein
MFPQRWMNFRKPLAVKAVVDLGSIVKQATA